MAIYHLRAKIIGRSAGRGVVAAVAYRSGGYSVVAMAAYRSGGELTDERLGKTWDYSKKGGIEHTEIMAPADAPDWVHDRSTLWNTVEASEKRKDAQLAREIEITLPRELTPEECLDLVRSFVGEQFVSRGMVADFAIHRTTASDNFEQPHAHILLTTRGLDPAGQGFGPKVREWNTVDLLRDWRETWAVSANRALEQAGSEERIDHRTLAEQGIERERQPYLPQFAFFDRVRELTDHIRDRFNQWVAVRHRNRVEAHVGLMERMQGEGEIENFIGAFLSRTARSLGLERLLDQPPPQQETGIER